MRFEPQKLSEFMHKMAIYQMNAANSSIFKYLGRKVDCK